MRNHDAANWLTVAFAMLLLFGFGGNGQTLEGQAPKTSTAQKGLDLPRPGEEPSAPGDRWALLVGINKYEHLPHLQFCAKDMETLRTVLIQYGGYKPERIRLLSDEAPQSWNPSTSNIKNALRQFLAQAKPEDTVLIAFSGHGVNDPKNPKLTYLMPIDGDQDDIEGTALAWSYVDQRIRDCRARQKVIMLDACHTGQTAEKGPADKPRSFDPDSLPRGKGTAVLCSCEVGQVSCEDEKLLKQGVFSYFIAKGIAGEAADRNGIVTVDGLYAYVHEKVQNFVRTNSRPQQNPVIKKAEVEGSIVLGSIKTARGGAVDTQQVLSRLEDPGRDVPLSKEVISDSKRWLPVDSSFAPASTTRVLISLLGEGKITEKEFRQLLGDRGSQIDSHLAAARSCGMRRTRCIAVGINRYGAGNDLAFAVSDAKFFKENLEKLSPRPLVQEDSILLLDEEATKERFLEHVQRSDSLKAGDLLVIYFAGRGERAGKRREKVDEWQSGAVGWVFSPGLTNAGAGASGHHRGLDYSPIVATKFDPQDPSLRSILSMSELQKILRNAQLKTKHNVLIVSDSCYADLPELAIIKGDREADSSFVFIGEAGEAKESSVLQHGKLTSLVVRGLLGEADWRASRRFSTGMGPDRSPPDGFVTMRELALFVRDNFSRVGLRANELPAIRGIFGRTDVVLTKPGLISDAPATDNFADEEFSR
jgi:hypothetical protein